MGDALPFAVESRLDNIEKELKEIRRKMYLESSKKRFFRSAGSWSKIDTDTLKKEIYDSREKSTRQKVEF
jgi:hypothetical protein